MTETTKTMNYDEMLSYAKTLHPNATISHNGSYGTWSISIESDIEVDMVLPDRFKDTPAWSAYNTSDPSYDNELLRWASKNGHSHLPLEALAELWNIEDAAKIAYLNEKERLMFEAFGDTFDFDALDNEGFSLYKKINAEANAFANDSVRALQDVFDAWWNN